MCRREACRRCRGHGGTARDWRQFATKRKCSALGSSHYAKLLGWLREHALDAVLISKRENVQYFSGFAGTAGVLAVTAVRRLIFVDFRYVEQAAQMAPAFQVIRAKGNPLDAALEWLKDAACERVGFEADCLTVTEYQRLLGKLGAEHWNAVQLDGLRAVKTAEEIEKIVVAAEIADEALTAVLPLIRPGETELAVAAALEYEMRKRGSQRPAFDTIVASGARAAMPHGLASARTIESGDFVVIDFGAVYQGYHSDMTRTVCLGRASPRQREIYATALRAQLAGLAAVADGALCREVDGAARDLLETAGFGEFFGHGLGHGVGLAIHEAPRLAPSAGDARLSAGMVVSVEPGIYLPEWGGVRIEDLVVVTATGCRIVSKMDKALLEL